MCGIMVVVYKETRSTDAHKLMDEMLPRLARRGHDSVTRLHFKPVQDGDWCVGVIGCVLHMRGELTPQPIRSAAPGGGGGEEWLLWNGEVFESKSFKIGSLENDGSALLKCLSSFQSPVDICRVFDGIHGPWSMVYYQASPPCLWFGRDSLGRRSLVWHVPDQHNDLFVVSSVCSMDSTLHPSLRYNWQEVPTLGLYRLPLTKDLQLTAAAGAIICYSWRHKGGDGGSLLLPEEGLVHSSLLTIDSNTHLTLPFQNLNHSLAPAVAMDTTSLLEECSVQLLQLLQEAVRVRLTARDGTENVGILFSGGLDSVIIAAIADRCLDVSKEIDLINVAFSQKDNVDYNVPDRKAAIQALGELNSKRKWNLIQVNVTSEELDKLRFECVHQLIHPLNTVMDDSIGCALWFAAQGKGALFPDGQYYESNSKVLLVGMGADEQFGGYARHRTAFERGGWQRVLEEVGKDIQRISTRNLGRDDRCISDHHREARYPYLDENIVNYANSLPIWIKTDYSHQRGLGEKILLRRVASLLGCVMTAVMPKRAIQFGSRIAKISGSVGGSHAGVRPMIKADSNTGQK